jgi:hypothetical protein
MSTSVPAKVPALVGLALVLSAATGCASRTAPFNDLDKAPMTILRLQGQEQAPQPQAQVPGQLIPGLPIPPEMQQAAQQVGQMINQAVPGLNLPIPGMQQQPQVQQQQQLPRFYNFVILDQRPVQDDALRAEILDLFGAEESFQTDRGNCFFPGMGVSFQRVNQPSVDLLVSLSCNQAMGNGFTWPYNKNGFTPASHQKLTGIYQRLWGPVPAGS